MRSDDGNIGSHAYFWYDSGRCACVDEGQPHKSGIQTGTAVHLDLERNPADGAGISDLFRFAKPGHYFQRYDSRRAFHVFKYRRIHCRNCPFRYPCY